MKLGYAFRGVMPALVALVLAACSSSDDGTGLLETNPAGKATLTITGPDNLVSGTSQDYLVTALDGTGDPVKGVSVSLATDLGTISQESSNPTTDVNGELTFTLSATKTGNSGTVTPVTGTASVTARGKIGDSSVDDEKVVTMAPTVFQFTSPTAGSRVAINTLQPLVLQWTANKVAVKAPVTFTAKVGTLVDNQTGAAASSLTVSTDTNGFARLQITSSAAGSEIVTAADASGDFTATLALTYFGDPATFTATAPATIDATNGAATIKVTVSDASGAAVAGATVSFAITGGSPSAGTLSAPSATTNSTGVAQTIYRANGGTGTATISITVGSLPVKSVSIVVGS